jgi:hypothetical protein
VDPTVEKVVRDAAQRGHGGGGGGQGGSGVDPTTEKKQRRRLCSVVVVVEPSLYISAAMMSKRTGSRWHGTGDGGDWVDGEAPTWTQ